MRHRRGTRTRVLHFNAYLYLLPALLLTVGTILYPVVFNVILSFKKTNIYTLEQSYFGAGNYISTLQSPRFWSAAGHTVSFSFGTALGALVLGLLAALCVHHFNFKHKRFILALLFVPWIMGGVETGLIAKWLLHPVTGPVGLLFSGLGLVTPGSSLLGKPETALLTITLVFIWKHVPFAMITTYAGIQSLPKEPYEAAALDGASSWKIFTHITLPQLRPILVTTLLLLAIWQFGAFTILQVMTAGGPLHSSEVLTLYMVSFFEARRFGKAATVSIVLFSFASLLTLLYMKMEFRHGEAR